MKHFSLLSLTLGAVVAAVSGQAQVTLNGDTVTVAHYYPDLSTIWSNGGAVSAPGSVTLGVGGPHYTVTLSGTRIAVDFVHSASWIDSAFDGLVVDEIDGTVVGAAVDTNLSGWDNSRLTYTAHFVAADWGGLQFTVNSYFNVDLTFQAVPEPAACGLVIAGGVLCGAMVRRQRRA